MAAAAAIYPPLQERPIKNTVVLFDVDETLSKARQVRFSLYSLQVKPLISFQFAKPEMLQLLSELRHKVAIGFVGGSNLVKQQEQLGGPVDVTTLFDFCFSENGLTAYRLGEELASTSFIGWIGQEKYNALAKWCVYVSLLAQRWGS